MRITNFPDVSFFRQHAIFSQERRLLTIGDSTPLA